MRREDDWVSRETQPFQNPRESSRLDVCLAVHRRNDVAAPFEPKIVQHLRMLSGDRNEADVHVSHDVANNLDAAGDALGRERLTRALVRREQERRGPVDLDPVVLLRHRQVAAPQAGLDVRERGTGRVRGPGARERRVRVAVDEHPVRPLRLDRFLDRRTHRLGIRRLQPEPVVRLCEVELVEEDLRQLRVVVLPGVQDDLVDSGLAQGQRQGRRLDELRPVPDDGEHFHGGYTTRRESGR